MENIVEVVVVGSGPAGLATSACLNRLNISHVLLEREDCYASLWKNRAYDLFKLHLAKQFCELPHMPFLKPYPNMFLGKNLFSTWILTCFKINPLCHRCVEKAFYDEKVEKWSVIVNYTESGVQESYHGNFLVVATGEKTVKTIFLVQKGEVIYSHEYGNGKKYYWKNVLVVRAGNSGMEIAYDLSNFGANTSIVVRGPVHVTAKEIMFAGMVLLMYLPFEIVDGLAMFLAWWKFGDLSEYGIQKPNLGPFYLKQESGQAPIIDVGTIEKIKSGEIQVLPSITSIEGNEIWFDNGYRECYDVIVFATGYKTNVLKWLKV